MWLRSKSRFGQFAYETDSKNRHREQGQHKAKVKQTHMLDKRMWKELATLLETPLFHSSLLSSQVNKLWHKTRP